MPGRPAVIHGVRHVVSPPDFLDRWPSEDQRTRMVFIGKGIPRLFRVAAAGRDRGRGARCDDRNCSSTSSRTEKSLLIHGTRRPDASFRAAGITAWVAISAAGFRPVLPSWGRRHIGSPAENRNDRAWNIGSAHWSFSARSKEVAHTDKGAVAANPGEQRGRVRPYWLIPSRVRCDDDMTNVLLPNSDIHLICKLRRSRRLDRNLA